MEKSKFSRICFMSTKFFHLIAENTYLLADGAIGTNLFIKGLQAGEMPELWNINNRSEVLSLHRSFIDAGSDIILTNSFGANKYRLALHGYENDVHQLNMESAKIARAIADEQERTIIVAGSIGPTGEILAPFGSLQHDDAVSAFEEQGKGLIEGGVDILWIETLSSQEEIKAAAHAACKLHFPYAVTVSFDTKGKTMMGLSSEQFFRLIHELPEKPIAFGANCGTGVGDILINIKQIMDLFPSIPVIAKANAGIPQYKEGHIVYDGTPELMALYAKAARDCGVCVIGGCCGTTPEHIQAMRISLDSTKKELHPPSFEEIKQVFNSTLCIDAPHTLASSTQSRGNRRKKH